MPRHSHDFVESYRGAGAYGFNRKMDEETIILYLQKFSDDQLITHLVGKMSDQELDEIYFLINGLMKTHLTKDEYDKLFLKEDSHPH